MSADNLTMNIYKRHRFAPAIIRYAVGLYHRFNLSHRDIEDLLAERGITVAVPCRLSLVGAGGRYPGSLHREASRLVWRIDWYTESASQESARNIPFSFSKLRNHPAMEWRMRVFLLSA